MALAFQQQLQETVQKLQALTDKEASAHVSEKFVVFLAFFFDSPQLGYSYTGRNRNF